MPTLTHSSSGDPLQAAIEFLGPFVNEIVERINVDEFTTVEFIEAMQLDPPTEAAYLETIRRWPEADEHAAKMVIHGQVIPTLLRQSNQVDWSGYAHGVADDYAVPAWWRKRPVAADATEPPSSATG